MNDLGKKIELDFFSTFGLVAVNCLLAATFIYTGSALAIRFIFSIFGIGCAAVLAQLIVKKKFQEKSAREILFFVAGAVAALTALVAQLIVPDFKPIFYTLCVVIGAGIFIALEQLDEEKKIQSAAGGRALTACALILSGFLIDNLYGSTLVVIAFAALAFGDAKNNIVKRIARDSSLMLLFLLLIRGVAYLGHSVIFDLGDPFVLVGIFGGFFAQRLMPLWKWTPLLALFFLEKFHGIVLLGAFLCGLLISELILPDTE
ncbi:MAG: hypothetical protein NT003_00360 [Candidatus Magasanikbacteria bacterium]|nr:hypothetical protein [Candidatus Magasanikbacteria bacterium]